MKEILPFRLQNKNIYLFANKLDFKYVMLSHPLLAKHLFVNENATDSSNDEDIYYQQKADYLKSKLPEKDHLYSGRIQPEQVEEAFLNLNQIVFEVTDDCNLNCTYCGYGDLYGNYDKRESKFMNAEDIAPLFSYLDDLQKKRRSNSIGNTIYISFYGGEPLMNMNFVKEVVSLIRNRAKDEHHYVFSMTTNAILLHRYMDYLAEHNFRLLISLDGNEKNNSYRITKSGKNSFDTIAKNIDLLRSKYPEYFQEFVNFNAVLHNNNSMEEIYNHIQTHYDKMPRIAELNSTGILPEKKDEFEKMYRNKKESLYESENYTKLEHELFTLAPSYYNATNFLHTYNLGVVRTYNDFFDNNKQLHFIPTGTCMPFSKKIFITVNGKILPCERIGHQHTLGQLSKAGVEIDFEKAASKVNAYYDRLDKQCSKCYQLGACSQCIFIVDDIVDGEKPVCYGFMNKNTFAGFLAANISFFESHPLDYYRIMEEVVLK